MSKLALQGHGESDYDRAIELDPNLASAYCNRAAIEFDQTHLDRALTDFNRAIQLKPRLSIAYVGRGRTEHAKDQLDAALKDFDRRSEGKRVSQQIWLLAVWWGYRRRETGDSEETLNRRLQRSQRNFLLRRS